MTFQKRFKLNWKMKLDNREFQKYIRRFKEQIRDMYTYYVWKPDFGHQARLLESNTNEECSSVCYFI